MSAKIRPTHDVFLDLETGGLRFGDRAWEVGMVVDKPGAEPELHHYYVSDFDPVKADPMALQMNGFYDRHPMHQMEGIGEARNADTAVHLDDHGLSSDPDAAPPQVHSFAGPEHYVAAFIAPLLRNARLCIINPSYDQPIVNAMLARANRTNTAYYTPVCIGSYAAGVLGMDPCAGSSQEIATRLGVQRETFGTGHTALVDALYSRAILRAAEEKAGVMPGWREAHAAKGA